MNMRPGWPMFRRYPPSPVTREILAVLLPPSRTRSFKQERAVEIIYRRFCQAEGATYRELAEHFGVSRERIRHAEAGALHRLRPKTAMAAHRPTRLSVALHGEPA